MSEEITEKIDLMHFSLVAIFVDHNKREIIKKDVKDPDTASIILPGINKEEFSYSKLEKIMQYYMDDSEDNLEKIIKQIRKEGFFYPPQPSMRLSCFHVDTDFVKDWY